MNALYTTQRGVNFVHRRGAGNAEKLLRFDF